MHGRRSRQRRREWVEEAPALRTLGIFARAPREDRASRPDGMIGYRGELITMLWGIVERGARDP